MKAKSISNLRLSSHSKRNIFGTHLMIKSFDEYTKEKTMEYMDKLKGQIDRFGFCYGFKL